MVGSLYLAFWAAVRPQTSPARPTAHNKSGWLGAVPVSGLNGSPAASATVGAEGG